MSSMQSQPRYQRPSSREQSRPAADASESSSQSPPQARRARSQSQAPSATSSEDSQTVFIDPTSSMLTETNTPKPAIPPPARPVADDEDVKKCWICFSDETEDTPESSAWRDPCPCALVAHEDCLLDWIADMESPSSRKRTLTPPRPLCPQCKTEVRLARPKNYLVEVVRAIERVSAKVTTPGILTVGLASVYAACMAHGRYSIFSVFGPEDGLRIMQPVFEDLAHPDDVRDWLSFKTSVADALAHWRLYIGVPLTTPILVLSRTSFADSILPVLPIVFFATQGDASDTADFASWPPSASLSMAVLPYLRGAYNAYYDRVWADKEKRWLKEIQPRSGGRGDDENPDAGGDAADANNEIVDMENNFEVRIDAGIWDEWGGAADEDDNAPQVAPPLDAPPLDENFAGNQNQQGGQQQRRQQQQQAAAAAAGGRNQGADNRQERLVSLNTTTIAEKVLGALFFPTIASLSGDLLARLLPKSWTAKPVGAVRATGLLQEKWGRSIVGACLFVVLKDAVMLYVRWKMASQHRRRRVLDFDRVKAAKAKAKAQAQAGR